MKKLFLYVFLGLLWCNVSSANCDSGIDETKLIGDATYSDGTPLEQGHQAVSCEGVTMYWSTNQKKYLTDNEYLFDNICLEDVERDGKIVKNTCEEETEAIPSDNLTGKKVYCIDESANELIGFHFIRGSKTNIYGYDEHIWIEVIGTYKTSPDIITIKTKYEDKDITFEINRKTLKMYGDQCFLYDKNLRKKIRKEYDKKIKKEKKGNKI